MVTKKKRIHKGSNPRSSSAKRKGSSAVRKHANSVDWNPARDSRYVDPEMGERPQMGIEERKAAQLAKWKKELGLEEDEEE